MHTSPQLWVRRSVVLLALAGYGLLADRCAASQLTVGDYTDGFVRQTSGAGPFNYLDTSSIFLSVRQFTDTIADRSIAKFNLGALPGNAVITSVSFEFDSLVVTGNTGRTVDVLGFNTVGGIENVDAVDPASALGSYDNFALGLGVQTISLNPAAFQSLVNTSTVIALRLQGVETTNTQIASMRDPGFTRPTLIIDYTTATPEPASIISALLAVVCLGAYGWVCRRMVADRALA
jgi:hypothetical protein